MLNGDFNILISKVSAFLEKTDVLNGLYESFSDEGVNKQIKKKVLPLPLYESISEDEIESNVEENASSTFGVKSLIDYSSSSESDEALVKDVGAESEPCPSNDKAPLDDGAESEPNLPSPSNDKAPVDDGAESEPKLPSPSNDDDDVAYSDVDSVLVNSENEEPPIVKVDILKHCLDIAQINTNTIGPARKRPCVEENDGYETDAEFEELSSKQFKAKSRRFKKLKGLTEKPPSFSSLRKQLLTQLSKSNTIVDRETCSSMYNFFRTNFSLLCNLNLDHLKQVTIQNDKVLSLILDVFVNNYSNIPLSSINAKQGDSADSIEKATINALGKDVANHVGLGLDCKNINIKK